MVEKVFGQARPLDLEPVSIYSPDTRIIGIIKTIVVCNLTAAAVAYRIFVDDDGTTYDQDTALAYDINILANTTEEWYGYYPMNNPDGNLAVRSSVAAALTFTAFGVEIG